MASAATRPDDRRTVPSRSVIASGVASVARRYRCAAMSSPMEYFLRTKQKRRLVPPLSDVFPAFPSARLTVFASTVRQQRIFKHSPSRAAGPAAHDPQVTAMAASPAPGHIEVGLGRPRVRGPL